MLFTTNAFFYYRLPSHGYLCVNLSPEHTRKTVGRATLFFFFSIRPTYLLEDARRTTYEIFLKRQFWAYDNNNVNNNQSGHRHHRQPRARGCIEKKGSLPLPPPLTFASAGAERGGGRPPPLRCNRCVGSRAPVVVLRARQSLRVFIVTLFRAARAFSRTVNRPVITAVAVLVFSCRPPPSDNRRFGFSAAEASAPPPPSSP